MKDNDLRGLVLKRFYDLRHEQIDIQFHDVLLPGEGMERVTSNICRQLSDHGLIDWQNHNSLDETSFGGIGYITANGVDVIEGHSRPPIAITVHDQSVAVHGSSNVQIGNENVLHANISIGQIHTAIDKSNTSPTQKAEAKSLWEKVFNNATFAAVIGALTAMGGSSAH
jgi:hypothetical protein